MADPVDPVASNPDLADALRLGGVETTPAPEADKGPIYRVIGDSRIPVSKAAGGLWKSRIDQAQSARGDIETCWHEAIRYYENDQMSYRKGMEGNRGGNRNARRMLSENWTETENVVFSNAVT